MIGAPDGCAQTAQLEAVVPLDEAPVVGRLTAVNAPPGTLTPNGVSGFECNEHRAGI